jgi:hypothetical protein
MVPPMLNSVDHSGRSSLHICQISTCQLAHTMIHTNASMSHELSGVWMNIRATLKCAVTVNGAEPLIPGCSAVPDVGS